jgi:hypothetical protein
MKLDSLRFAPPALVVLAGVFAACTVIEPARIIEPTCDDPGKLLIRGEETGLEFCSGEPSHRAKIVACSTFTPAPGACGEPDTFVDAAQCHTNADCAALSPLDVCVAPGNGGPCACVPSCVHDSDCKPDEICRCGDPVSTCRPALCASDADCGAGSRCMEADPEKCGVQGFACTSVLDECLSSLDCTGPWTSLCLYVDNHRVCAAHECFNN